MSQNKPLVSAIDHCSLIVANTIKALDFYKDILGLEVDDSRPDLGYPGAWLQIANGQIHLLELPNPDPVDNRPEHGGRDRWAMERMCDGRTSARSEGSVRRAQG